MREKQISTETIYKGKILTLEKDKVLCPSGNISTREVIRHQNSVAILAKVNNKFIFIKQFRYPYDEIIWEIPAGKIDNNEEPLLAAIRELEEETGYKANDLTYLGKMYPTCAYTDEIIYLYYTDHLEKTKQNLDQNEVVQLYYLSNDEIDNMILNGEFKDAKILSALAIYKTQKRYDTKVYHINKSNS